MGLGVDSGFCVGFDSGFDSGEAPPAVPPFTFASVLFVLSLSLLWIPVVEHR